MWHELVLHGVGGRTIAEAKERMTYAEAQQWFAYIKEHGPLNVARVVSERLEYGFAMLATVVNNSNGGKAKITDFLPKPEEKAVEPEDTLGAVAALLKGVAAKNGAARKRSARKVVAKEK